MSFPGWLEPLESRRLLSVASVELGGSTWSAAFINSLVAENLGAAGYRITSSRPRRDIPWSTIDRVTVRFTAPVDVQAQDLLVSGASGGQYPVSGVTYEPTTLTATWTLGRQISKDRLLLRWRAPDGSLSDFRANILAGDVSRDGSVNDLDVDWVRRRQGTRAQPVLTGAARGPAYSVFADFDGSGTITAIDLATARGRQGRRLPSREAEVKLPALPSSDAWYGAVVNARTDIAIPFNLRNLPSKLSLVTDMSGSGSAPQWNAALAALQASNPQLLIGAYHSARDAQLTSSLTAYPVRAVPKEGLADSQILMPHPADPGVWIVDYSQPAARQYLVDHIVRDVLQTGRPLAFLDSVSHNESGFPLPWATTMQLVREIATDLHAMGRRVIINAAWVPGWTSNESVEQLIATGVDGVSLEMGYIPTVRSSVARTQTAIAQYRRMLDAGLTVAFVPVATPVAGVDTTQALESEQRLHAAFGMMFRKPGDKLFVSENFWRPVPDWVDWPTRFGAPVADATVATNASGQVVLSRRFTHYTFTLNAATKQVTVTPTGV